MRQIKFRGTDLETGECKYFLFFNAAEDKDGAVDLGFFLARMRYLLEDEGEVKDFVQLIGVDCNGEEVYEGDKIYIGTRQFTASFDDYKLIRQGKVKKCGR